MITHLAALAAAHPAPASNAQYATETWTPGGTALAVIIIAVLIFAWLKLVPSGPKVSAYKKRMNSMTGPAKAKTSARTRVPVRR